MCDPADRGGLLLFQEPTVLRDLHALLYLSSLRTLVLHYTGGVTNVDSLAQMTSLTELAAPPIVCSVYARSHGPSSVTGNLEAEQAGSAQAHTALHNPPCLSEFSRHPT